jgi:hypothetical protein
MCGFYSLSFADCKYGLESQANHFNFALPRRKRADINFAIKAIAPKVSETERKTYFSQFQRDA